MDPGLRSPLLDFFRRGDVARDVRALAARGALAPRAHEQLALLVLLTDDPDPQIAATAAETIDAIPRDALTAFLARTDTSDELRAFFRERGIEPAAIPAPSADAPLIETDSEAIAALAAEHSDPAKPISLLPVMERLKLAMRGTREQRGILIRDANKLVAAAVLSSPKLTDSEIEGYARMANVAEEVLRIIGTTRSWVKNYAVAAALVRNPKTPLGISMNLVSRLNERDVKLLSMDRNVPEPLRLAARKNLLAGQARKR